MIQLTLVDIAGSLFDAAGRAGWPGKSLQYTRVQDIEITPGMAFVSPANSIGFMDGGVDFAYSRVMFPGVEAEVMKRIATEGMMGKLDRRFLPIGRALIVEARKGVFLVVAPTMLLPQDVRDTHNAYHATYAAVAAALKDRRITHVVFPGMATGVGAMSPGEALKQMTDAVRDAAAGAMGP
jgi:O-acetyl-ADP-ribose deacetylase (regulator of RNase III)